MYGKTPDRSGWILAAVAVTQLMVALDMTVVNVALPEIGDALGFADADLAWVVNGYTLAFGGLLLLGGRLGDLLGRRPLLLGSLVLFAAASAVGGAAGDPGLLVAARALQGVAAAAMAPAALAVLTVTFAEGPERTRALTIWTAISALGGAIGVLVGGVLADVASWRWVLWINVPIALLALALVLREVPGGRPAAAAARPRPDVGGGLLATAGMTLLVLAVVRTDAHGWGSATTLGTLAAALALLAAFVAVEARAAQPLLRPGLLRQRGPGAANLVMALLCAGQFAALYFVSLQLQRVLGYAPLETGLALLPFCVGLVAGSVAAMRLVRTRDVRVALVPGALLTALGMAGFAAVDPGTSFLGGVLGPMLVASVGFGLCFVPATAAATAGVAPAEAGMAAGLVNSSRQVGGAIGLAALATVAVAHEAALRAAGRTPIDALSGGHQRGLAIAAAVLVAAAVAGLLLPPRAAPAAVAGPTREPAPAAGEG